MEHFQQRLEMEFAKLEYDLPCTTQGYLTENGK
jgi:hypothetical protein